MDSNIRLLIFLILSLTNCSGNKIKKHINSFDISVEDSTVVNISYIINHSFDWYVITGGFVFCSELSEQLGFEYKGRTPNDDQWMVVFVKDDRIVYKELFSTHFIDYFPNINVWEKVDSPMVLYKKIGPGKYNWYKKEE